MFGGQKSNAEHSSKTDFIENKSHGERVVDEIYDFSVDQQEIDSLEPGSQIIIYAKDTGSFFIPGGHSFTNQHPGRIRPNSGSTNQTPLTGQQSSSNSSGAGGSSPSNSPGNSSGNGGTSTPAGTGQPQPPIPKGPPTHMPIPRSKQQPKSKNYSDIMDELEAQKDKKNVQITVGNKTYELKNQYNEGALTLQDDLAGQMYKNIRKDKNDVAVIAERNTLDPKSVQRCKDHVFHNEHYLDLYEDLGEPGEYARFDPNLQQALAWERFKNGVPTPQDREWLRHELCESVYETRHNAGYRESHAYAQNRADGNPWESWKNQ